VHCTFLLSVVLPSIICSSDQSFGSIQSCIVVILCPSPSAACSVSTSLFFFVRWLPNPENCVLSAFHLFVYSISWDHIKLPSQSQYFKNGRMELLNTCDPLKSPMEVEKSVLRKVATLQHLLCFRRTDRASQARKERSSGCHPTKGLDIVSLISKN
jgi:hypothetical protein